MSAISFADLANERISTSRGAMLRAFAYVLETAGRRRVTDLHVRRLLNYVRAHDRYYTGVPRSLARLARKLVLSVSTCRAVIRRAVEEFNLLIVIPQRHNRGGQTVNRYTISWDNVDAILYDIELAQCAAANDANTDSTPPINNIAPDDELEALILHDRLLNSHPRILRVPKHLFPNPWPFAVRRYPRETPKELLAHFDVLLAKLQTAIDRAKQLGATKIQDRLTTLWDNLSAVHYRASHAAMCRTNLPPTDLVPKSPRDKVARPDFSQFDFSWLTNRKSRHEAPVTKDHPPVKSFASAARTDATALSDHPLYASSAQTYASAARTLPESTYSLNTYGLQPKSPVVLRLASAARTDATALSDQAPVNLESSTNPAICPSCYDLLVALDELIAALTLTARCARDYAIDWLQDRFTSLRASIKSICTHLPQCLPCYDSEICTSPAGS